MPRLGSRERQQLVERNLRLAYYLARKIEPMGVDLEDLEQAAALGLCAAAQIFDPDSHPGVKFGTFARDYVIRYLTEEITRHVRSEAHAHLRADVAEPGPSATEDRMALEVWEALESLPPREKLLIVRRFGLDGGPPCGLIALSFHFGIPVRTISRLLAAARELIGDALRSRGWTQERWAEACCENPSMRMA